MHPDAPFPDEFDRSSVVFRDETPDDQTVASGSYMAEDDADRMIQHKVCCALLTHLPFES